MGGTKARALAEHCHSRGRPLLRFDYDGHGASSGEFRQGSIGRWLSDALAAIDRLTRGPQVLVGSSMGGWIALLAALARPERVAGILGIAAAPDFTEDLIWERLDASQRRRLTTEGVLLNPSAYEPDVIPITWRLVEEGRRHLLLRGPIGIACPVRLLHGMADPDVPWQTALSLAERLSLGAVAVELIEDGDHRLSRPQDLERIFAALEMLSAPAPG
jgi:pimeloyl-ACP methyl ester carboxylesterase